MYTNRQSDNMPAHAALIEAPKRQPQVGAAIERLSMCISDLDSAMGALSARVDPVLRPDPGQTTIGHATGGAQSPAAVRCHAATTIDAETDRIYQIVIGLRDILDRLEV